MHSHCSIKILCDFVFLWMLLIWPFPGVCAGPEVELGAAVHMVVSLDDLRSHYDVIKWRHFPHYWPFVRGNHQSPVNSPHKEKWCGALMFYLICAWTNCWVNNRNTGDLRCHSTHYDITVMQDGSLFHAFTPLSQEVPGPDTPHHIQRWPKTQQPSFI